jgi:hypothetical protein
MASSLERGFLRGREMLLAMEFPTEGCRVTRMATEMGIRRGSGMGQQRAKDWLVALV